MNSSSVTSRKQLTETLPENNRINIKQESNYERTAANKNQKGNSNSSGTITETTTGKH
jgi:hypothetical protein